MAPKPETRLVNKMMDRLKAEGGFWFKVHGSVFQTSGVPDILGCWKGRFVAIEAKCEGNGPSEIQKDVMKLIHSAGGRTGVAYSVTEALDVREGRKTLW